MPNVDIYTAAKNFYDERNKLDEQRSPVVSFETAVIWFASNILYSFYNPEREQLDPDYPREVEVDLDMRFKLLIAQIPLKGDAGDIADDNAVREYVTNKLTTRPRLTTLTVKDRDPNAKR